MYILARLLYVCFFFLPFSLSLLMLWRTHKFGSLTVNGQTVSLISFWPWSWWDLLSLYTDCTSCSSSFSPLPYRIYNTHPWSVKKANWLTAGHTSQENPRFLLIEGRKRGSSFFFSFHSLGASSIHISDAIPPYSRECIPWGSVGRGKDKAKKKRNKRSTLRSLSLSLTHSVSPLAHRLLYRWGGRIMDGADTEWSCTAIACKFITTKGGRKRVKVKKDRKKQRTYYYSSSS